MEWRGMAKERKGEKGRGGDDEKGKGEGFFFWLLRERRLGWRDKF
jgi:hypothetical protein